MSSGVLVVAAVDDDLDAANVLALQDLLDRLQAARVELGACVELLRGPGNTDA